MLIEITENYWILSEDVVRLLNTDDGVVVTLKNDEEILVKDGDPKDIAYEINRVSM